jgi:hypothetical protein
VAHCHSGPLQDRHACLQKSVLLLGWDWLGTGGGEGEVPAYVFFARYIRPLHRSRIGWGEGGPDIILRSTGYERLLRVSRFGLQFDRRTRRDLKAPKSHSENRAVWADGWPVAGSQPRPRTIMERRPLLTRPNNCLRSLPRYDRACASTTQRPGDGTWRGSQGFRSVHAPSALTPVDIRQARGAPRTMPCDTVPILLPHPDSKWEVGTGNSRLASASWKPIRARTGD